MTHDAEPIARANLAERHCPRDQCRRLRSRVATRRNAEWDEQTQSHDFAEFVFEMGKGRERK